MLVTSLVNDVSRRKDGMMKYIIDRFEGKLAICEDEQGNMINLEKNKIPSEAIEGDILKMEGNQLVINQQETKARKKQINELAKDLFK